MFLNDATIDSYTLNGVTYNTKIAFLKALAEVKNLSTDFVVDNKVFKCNHAMFSYNSGYLIANVDGHFALTEPHPTNNHSIEVRIHTADGSGDILSSETNNLNFIVPANDVDADLYFVVGSVFPFNDLKKVVPESNFISLGTSNMPQVAFSSLDNAVEVGP